jgi:H+/gluconate symporter-like permease
MEETTFAADPMRLMIAAAVGIVILLVLIIKFKLHPVLSMMISAIIIGAGAGMPLTMISDTVEKGVGKTLQGIALLVGLGSMFGGILEVSGGAQRIAETLISKFGQKKAGWALGLTGLVIGTTVFFEAGVVVLIPLVFSVAKQTRKSTLYYAIPLLSGLASGYAFVPPSAGSVLVANALGVNLGTMIMVGVPTALICPSPAAPSPASLTAARIPPARLCSSRRRAIPSKRPTAATPIPVAALIRIEMIADFLSRSSMITISAGRKAINPTL